MTDHPAAFDNRPMRTDTQLENQVLDALKQDRRIRHPELIAVSVDAMGTVVLHGAAGSLPEKLAAVHDARQVEGTFQVVADDLKVHLPIGDRRADDEIRATAIQQVIGDSRIVSTHIHVDVSHGWVKLTGYVRHPAESDAAVEDVAGLTGVLGVSNDIEVRSRR